MSDKHTPGRLSFLANPIEPNKYVIAVNDQRWFMSILHNGEQWEPEQRENMRRLVACWNACEGLPTAWIEGGAADILEHAKSLKSQRDELLTVLKALTDRGRIPPTGLAFSKARAAIAKAEASK